MSYKKDEGDGPIVRVDRTAVFQEARVFNSSPISPRKCRILLTKIALLLFQGEKFPQNEATELFFGISKLFQNKDASLRQMVYLVAKELSSSAEDVIMITSSVMRDISQTNDAIYRPNALRALVRIIDSSTVQAIERLLKTAIVDKVASVQSAALVSSYRMLFPFHHTRIQTNLESIDLLPIAKQTIQRFQNEVSDAAAAKGGATFSLGFGGAGSHASLASTITYTTQYHALGLLYQMRSHDRMALVKMIQQYSQAGVLKSPTATVVLVRLTAKLIEDEPSLRKQLFPLLDGWLKHKSEMVNIEAAKAIVILGDASEQELTQTLHVLQLFLASPRAITKFAALRVLNQLATSRPDSVRSVNPDIEGLINNSNRAISTLAITTLLRTGNESSVDRLRSIGTFMSELSEEFRVTIVEAIRTLCLKYPNKGPAMLQFLSGILREEGGYEFKRAVVESMFDLVRYIPQVKDDALGQLAEFIEDCEFTKLAVRILHLLGVEGPKANQPTKYIRAIYNRVVLENAIVRAAAVTALGKFGLIQNADVKNSVRVLLTRCLDDTDDEVRDRAAFNLRMIDEDEAMATRFLRNDSMFSLPVLEKQLVMYVTSEADNFATPFDLSKIPVVTREQADAEERSAKLTAATPTIKAPSDGPKPSAKAGTETAANAAAAAHQYAEQLQQIPELAAYGGVLKSSPVVELTESETEYVCKAVKHVFKEAIVLQFDIKNTLPETVLTDVTVISTPSDEEEGLQEEFVIPAPQLKTNEPGTVYVAFKRAGGASDYVATTFTNILKFTSREIDPTTGEPEAQGYDDEYQVEDLDLAGADYVVPAYAGSFDNVWEQAAAGGDASETLQLGNVKSISGSYFAPHRAPLLGKSLADEVLDAVERLSQALSLQPLEGTDVAVSTSTHTLRLYGKTVGGGKVAAMVRMAYSARSGVTVQIKCRAEEEGVAALVVASVS